MTCFTLRAQLHEYLDGELLPARREMVEACLARCRACRETVAAERAFLRRIRHVLRSTEVPHWLSARVSAALAVAASEPGR